MSTWIFRFSRYLSSTREHFHLTTYSVSWFHEKSSFHQLKIESFQRKIEFFFIWIKLECITENLIIYYYGNRIMVLSNIFSFLVLKPLLSIPANAFVEEVPIFYCDKFRWIINETIYLLIYLQSISLKQICFGWAQKPSVHC